MDLGSFVHNLIFNEPDPHVLSDLVFKLLVSYSLLTKATYDGVIKLPVLAYAYEQNCISMFGLHPNMIMLWTSENYKSENTVVVSVTGVTDRTCNH